MKFRRARDSDFSIAGLWFLSAAGAAAAALFLHAPVLMASGCPFKSITGVACPTCGTTRALQAFLAGHPGTALLLNPLAVTLSAVFFPGGLIAPAWVALRAPVPDRLTALPTTLRIAITSAFAANWIYLVIAGV